MDQNNMINKTLGMAMVLPLLILVVVVVITNISQWIKNINVRFRSIEFSFQDTLTVFTSIIVVMAFVGIYLLTGPWW